METDPHQLSPSPPIIHQLNNRRLKRLKKSDDSNELPQSIEDPILSQDTEEGDKTQVEAATKTKRILMFDDDININTQNLDSSVKVSNGNSKEWKTKNKRTKRDKSTANKRGKEKERKAYLQDLHAESQRLLRETRNAAFKPIPVVKKPISSVLEKIRKRKLEISRMFMIDRIDGYEENSSQEDGRQKTGDEMDEKEKRNIDGVSITDAPNVDESKDAPNVDESKDAPEPINYENDFDQVLLNKTPTNVFRGPMDDTQDLFVDSEPNGISAEQNEEQLNNHPEEELAPSLLSVNLTLDSVPIDDSSSDEEDNDKENLSPHPRVITECRISLKGKIAKDFVDDEAEEEDNDSDHDTTRFKENEDEDIDDLEELNDMIATTYKEKHTDKEKRHELHQKWLEQQDAAGTDNLIQRLKFGTEVRGTSMLDEEPESEEDGDSFDNEVNEESLPVKSAKVNIRKAKQIILQFASDKEDIYVSDEEEDAYSRYAHHRLLTRKEEQITIVSPADDEKSREVMGLIKKLNVVSDKKKPKTSSFFDSVLKGGDSNSSSKSSFLGRVSKHPIPSSRKQGSGTFRSFIFGRDDSNSRSSVSTPEDSSDIVSQEAKTTRNLSAKYGNNSQSKLNDRNRDAAPETRPGTTLLDIMMRPPSQSQVYHHQKSVDLTNRIFASRAPKKFATTERRR